MIGKWKKLLPEHNDIDHTYSLVSDYYKLKEVKGETFGTLTFKGNWKILEKQLNKETHNLLVYLKGSGNKLKTENLFENGDIR